MNTTRWNGRTVLAHPSGTPYHFSNFDRAKELAAKFNGHVEMRYNSEATYVVVVR